MSNNNSGSPDSHRSIIKSTSVISAGTLTSRVLGFFRDIIMAKFFGTGIQADAFFVAFKIPNLFRELVGEGAANSAVVPVFSEYLVKKDKEEFWRFVSVVLTLALVILSFITLLGIVFAPFIVRIIAPGFADTPEKFSLTINLTRIMFPYLIFIGFTAYGMAILYSFRIFAVSAFSPCLLNIAVIISALISVRYLPEPIYGLAIGVLIGGVLQSVVHIKPLLKIGFKLRPSQNWKNPGVARIGKLLLPRIFGAGIYQMTVFIDTLCASLWKIVGFGGISAINYSNRIIQFPMGVFSVALASAMLPTLAGFASSNNIERLKKTVIFSIENVFLIMFPSSAILMILSTPIIRVLFERGQFDEYSTTITSLALLFYSIGLVSFGGVKILVTVFHSIQDTKTPVIVAAVCLCLNVALNFILMVPLKVGGIALASSIVATINFMTLFHLLDKRLGGLSVQMRAAVLKILGATILMAGVVQWSWSNMSLSNEGIKLMIVGTMGFIFYAAVCYYLNIEQARKVWAAIRRKITTSS